MARSAPASQADRGTAPRPRTGAKVESVYARKVLGEERIAGLRAARRRLRSALLRLTFRRTERWRRR